MNKKAKRTPKCHFENTVNDVVKPICGQLNGTKTAFAQTLYTTETGSVTCKRCLGTKALKFRMHVEATADAAARAAGGDSVAAVFTPAGRQPLPVVLSMDTALQADGSVRVDGVIPIDTPFPPFPQSYAKLADAVLDAVLAFSTPIREGRFNQVEQQAADAVLAPLLKAGTVRWLTGTDGVRTRFYEDDEPLPDEILAKPFEQSLDEARAKLASAPARPSLLRLVDAFKDCPHPEVFGAVESNGGSQ